MQAVAVESGFEFIRGQHWRLEVFWLGLLHARFDWEAASF
jgi:hypothetical protein